MHFYWVSEEKSTRSKTTPLLSYRDTLYIYPETGCVDVVPRGNVSGISCPVVVGNSPPSAFSLCLSLCSLTQQLQHPRWSFPSASYSSLLSCNPIAKLPRVSIFVYLASISYARGGWASIVLKINYNARPFVVRPFSRPADSSQYTSIFAFPAFVFPIIAKEHTSTTHLDYLLAAHTNTNRLIFICYSFIKVRTKQYSLSRALRNTYWNVILWGIYLLTRRQASQEIWKLITAYHTLNIYNK